MGLREHEGRRLEILVGDVTDVEAVTLSELDEPQVLLKQLVASGENDARPAFCPVDYAGHKVVALDGSSDVWTVTNRFEAQPLRLRIEPLMAAGAWEAETNIALATPENLAALTNRASAPGISSDVALVRDIVKTGASSARITATNSSGAGRGAWTKIERTFDPPLNLSGREGLGVWVYGDGQGEILNFQLRSPEHVVAGIGDHYVVIDFTGWRYFELVEPESRRWAQYKWPYGDPYAIYRESVSFGQVSSLSIWLNEIPPGKSVTCYLDTVKALALTKATLRRPAITIGNQTITFPAGVETGSYLEMNSPTDCKVFGSNGELKAELKPEGGAPRLLPGWNQLRFTCEATPGVRARANVTVISQGANL